MTEGCCSDAYTSWPDASSPRNVSTSSGGYEFTEVKIGNQYLAQFLASTELPEGLVSSAYLILFRRDQALVGSDAGGSWDIIHGDLQPAEPVQSALDRLAQEQVGATVAGSWLVGYFQCRALSGAPVGRPGETVYWPVYVGAAGQLLDHPAVEGRTRRQVTTRDLLQLIRGRYYELCEPLLYATDQWLRLQASGSTR